MSTRRVAPLTLDNLGDLPTPCRECVFWELAPGAGRTPGRGTDENARQAKEAWLSATLLEWGSCGRVAYVDQTPAGYAIFAPPPYVPRSSAFATSPVSSDAALLTAVRVVPALAGHGLGRLLVQSVAKDLLRRRVHAIEAFGDLRWREPSCLVPGEFLLALGFKTVRPHPRHPRMRLDLRSIATWREDVEVALERLLGAIGHPEGALRPI